VKGFYLMHEKWRQTMVEEHETELPAREITWGPEPLGGKEPNKSVWRGGISAKLNIIKDRFALASETAARGTLDALKAQVEHFYVISNTLASIRCIDGRGEGDEFDKKTVLGPQVPGGAPVMALAWRTALGFEPGINIDSDVVTFKGILKDKKLPFLPGAHEDEHNTDDPENTGCGAIDKMLGILEIMDEAHENENGDKIYSVYDYTKAIAQEYCGNNEAIFDSTFSDIQVKLEIINAQRYNDRYFMKDEPTGKHRFRQRVVNRIKEVGHEAGCKTVETLRGTHNEAFLLINKATGETFDRDAFSALTDNKVQVFGYDVWHAVERAKAIFPDDQEKQQTMVVTNVMYAVATAMALTDGSLEYGIRMLD
jgi:hypothetical protein